MNLRDENLKLLDADSLPIIFVIEIVTIEEERASFQLTVSPQAQAIAALHAKSAFGKF